MPGFDKELLSMVSVSHLHRSCCLGRISQLARLGMYARTAISKNPALLAKCREVLLLSSKSGFCNEPGLFRTMRFTRRRSLIRMARRRRSETSIISASLCSALPYGVVSTSPGWNVRSGFHPGITIPVHTAPSPEISCGGHPGWSCPGEVIANKRCKH